MEIAQRPGSEPAVGPSIGNPEEPADLERSTGLLVNAHRSARSTSVDVVGAAEADLRNETCR